MRKHFGVLLERDMIKYSKLMRLTEAITIARSMWNIFLLRKYYKKFLLSKFLFLIILWLEMEYRSSYFYFAYTVNVKR